MPIIGSAYAPISMVTESKPASVFKLEIQKDERQIWEAETRVTNMSPSLKSKTLKRADSSMLLRDAGKQRP